MCLRYKKGLLAACWLACLMLPAGSSLAQAQITEEAGMVKLDASGEMELRSLVEYVAERAGIRFMYDGEAIGKKVNIVVPDPIPVSSLLDVLQSVLKNEGLIIADAGVDGWKRIIPIARIPEVARPLNDQTDLSELGQAEPLTRVFTLKNAEPSKISELVKPTMSQAGSSIVPVDNQRILIVTDVGANVRRVAQLIELLDSGKPLVDIEFVPARFVQAADLADRLSELLAARARALGRDAEKVGSGIEVSVDERTNQVVLIGNIGELAEAKSLLAQLDKQLATKERSFSLQFATPEQFDQIVKSSLAGRAAPPPYKSRIEGRTLSIESTEEALALAEQLRQRYDTLDGPDEQSPIRFYKVRNVPAEELLRTIQSIFTGEIQSSRQTLSPSRRGGVEGIVPAFGNSPFTQLQGAQLPQLYPQQAVPAYVLPQADTPVQQAPNAIQQANAAERRQDKSVFSSELIGDAQVSFDAHTNTIIVVAKPQAQGIYAHLIKQLDQRRPQVLIEAKIVIIDTSDDFTLGVEVSGGDRTGGKRAFAFTSFGFSSVDPVSGALSITPGVGFNGTLVDPSTADVVVRALSTHRRARVLSSPRILVNDNAQGELTSVIEIPFTSVNASTTVATTSFAGFAEAGTTINVTPTISDDDYLQLDYTVTLNTFTGDGADGVPPPRQTNEVRSRVSVPDGYTVIVGGLKNKNDVSTYRGLPFLEKIPVLRDLTGTTSNSQDETSLFVFLRPVILRDDKFKELKYISDSQLEEACLPGQFPASRSQSIR